MLKPSTSQVNRINSWLALGSVPAMGYIKLKASADRLSCSLLDLASQPSNTLRSIGWSEVQIQSLSTKQTKLAGIINATKKWQEASPQHHFIGLDDLSYPSQLKEISRPPLYLYVDGNLDLLNQPQLAFVGSRKPSLYAHQVCQQLICELANISSLGITSGMALGVDAYCHQASIANKLPTIGVLGCGIDVIYPKRHKDLYAEVAKQGALVSEFILGAKPVANMFPRRNRIISGLSLGTVVVEAQIKSGSLVTAKYAAEQNREVFAVPNNITNPNAEGCHWLIKQGAKLIDGAQDIIDELPALFELQKSENSEDEKKNEKNRKQSLASDPLLDSVNYSATSVDVIAKRSGMSVSDVLTLLLEYELRGIVASTVDGYIKLRG